MTADRWLAERERVRNQRDDLADAVRAAERRVAALEDVLDRFDKHHNKIQSTGEWEQGLNELAREARTLLDPAPSEPSQPLMRGMNIGPDLTSNSDDPAALPAEVEFSQTGKLAHHVTVSEASDHDALVASGLHECASDCQSKEPGL